MKYLEYILAHFNLNFHYSFDCSSRSAYTAIVSLGLLLINVKFIVHHMLKRIKTEGKKH